MGQAHIERANQGRVVRVNGDFITELADVGTIMGQGPRSCPLAVVGGLSVSMLLTLFVVSRLYLIVNRLASFDTPTGVC